MVDISFLKKLKLPKFSLELFSPKPHNVAGIDIALHSTKVVQLKYERERAILETYGELLSQNYLKENGGTGTGLLRYSDADLSLLIRDIIKESNVSAKDAIISIPAPSSFITAISFPNANEAEINQAMPYEARKYVPIPIAEVELDWEILERNEEKKSTDVLLVAVPKEMIDKLKRVAEQANLTLRAVEIESFSMARSLIGQDPTPTAILNLGHQTTTLAVVDRKKVRASHTFDRGSQELTRALEKGLGISSERAEAVKKEVGLGGRSEDQETASIITPLVETLFSETDRVISNYNRKAPRKIQKINLTGGGSRLKGLADYVNSKLGLETINGNPFARVVTPPFLQPILSEISPSFAVAVGLALREITN